MLETEEFEEGDVDTKQPKSFVVAGLAILIVGITSGAIYRYNQITNASRVELAPQEEVEGTIEEETQLPVETYQTPAAATSTDVEVKSSTGTKPSPPAPKGGSPSPVKGEGNTVADYCSSGKKTRDQKYVQAESDYTAAATSIEKTFTIEQAAFTTSLSALAKKKNDAINQYLTGVALATSKYNSSSEPDAYETYQKDQALALTTYTELIAKINTEETPVVAAKAQSETKHSVDLTAAADKRNADKAAADTEYNTQTLGKDCA